MRALNTGQNPQLGDQYLENLHNQIALGYRADIFEPIPANDRMTATEINARLQQKMQAASPLLSRITEEFLAPIILDLLEIMIQRRVIDPPPKQTPGVVVKFMGPLALSQNASEIVNIESFIQSMAPLVQADPQALDKINIDETADHMSVLHNVPQRLIRSDDQVAEIRKQRAETERALQQAQVGREAAAAAKDLSQAAATVAG
jgi:hypothetical protein